MKAIKKIKHWWYTYVRNKPESSPLYYTKPEISRRVLKRFGIKPNKVDTYTGSSGDMYFSTAIDAICGDVIFAMTSAGNVPADVVKTYEIDAHNFLHMQWDGTGYRQHIWYVPYKYFHEYYHEDGKQSAKFDEKMLSMIINYLGTTVDEIKENYND
jgi:hypothetical protein